ncbi:lipopolysaccharide heptosyltransferase II [Candidatus Woesearchaeota archaeon]|nr:lipopolysaccharide heptosyltransferase II [Candidatus Woesearchaeota archaeon]
MLRAIFPILRLFFLRKAEIVKPRKILIIRSGAIGDVLMTTPLIKSIRSRFPKSEISYLCGKWSKEAIETNHDVDKLIVFDDDIIFKKKLFRVFKLVKKIKKQKFDLCFILDKSYLWNLFAYFCRVPVRIGFDRFGEGFSNTHNVRYDGSKHEVDYYLDIARLINAKVYDKMEFFVAKKDVIFADKFFSRNKLSNVIGIAPGGAGNPGQKMFAKRWPKGKYEKLIEVLLKKHDIILFGGKNDVEITREILNNLRNKGLNNKILDTAGKVNLKQTAALMKKCKLVISNDSGPMHLAVAVGAPLIAIFGPTDPKRFGPRKGVVLRKKIKCTPCYDVYGRFRKCEDYRCMESISVDDILANIRR